jgi:hypothetical protein
VLKESVEVGAQSTEEVNVRDLTLTPKSVNKTPAISEGFELSLVITARLNEMRANYMKTLNSSSGLRPIWPPTLDTLRNFFFEPTVDTKSIVAGLNATLLIRFY